MQLRQFLWAPELRERLVHWSLNLGCPAGILQRVEDLVVRSLVLLDAGYHYSSRIAAE